MIGSRFFGLFLLCFVLYGCPPAERTGAAMKQFRANHFDFFDLKRNYFEGIYLDLPTALISNYNTSHLYKNNGLSLSNHEMGVYFSVEKFTKSEAEGFRFPMDEGISHLDAVHIFYTEKRAKSLEYLARSIRTDLPQGSRFPGSMEVMYGRKYDGDADLKYMIATVEKGGSCYVIQLISNAEMSAYLLDDFNAIIKSIR